MVEKISLEELSRIVVDAAFHIHLEMGGGLLESVYQKVLSAVLEKRGLRVETEVPIVFTYEGMRFQDDLRIDLLVEGALIVELKSVEKIVPVHLKQLTTYLRLSGKSLGLLINFGGATFKENCRRIVNGAIDLTGSTLRINP